MPRPIRACATSIVANRTFERATELAERYGAVAMHYDECWAALADVDVLVCSTAAPRPVVFVEHVRPALAARGDRPLCILDIALPRDVDPAVGKLDNVFLYNLDDLQAVVSANLERRRAELPTAEQLIASEVGKLLGVGRRPGGGAGAHGDARADGGASATRELADALATVRAPLARPSGRPSRNFREHS